MTGQQQVHQAEEAQFIENVQRKREAKGWSQGELARRMSDAGFDGFHQTTISRIEKGQRPVRLAEARALANILGSQVGLMVAPPTESAIVENLASRIGLIRRARRRIRDEIEVIAGLKTDMQVLIAETETIPREEWQRLGLWETISDLIVEAGNMQKWSAQSILAEDMGDPNGVHPEA